MKKPYQLCMTVGFLTLLAIFSLALFLRQPIVFSENENRYLQQKPVFSVQALLKGQYTKEWETYLDDQFPLRDRWMSLKTELLRGMGNREINGVYFARDGSLMEQCRPQDFPQEQLAKNVDSLNVFLVKHNQQRVSVLLAPTAAFLAPGKLPANTPLYDQNQALDFVRDHLKGAAFLDIRDRLTAHADELLYYKTDHHWTTLGAYYAYEEWEQQHGRRVNRGEYHIEPVTDSFRGSLYSKVLNRNAPTDTIELYQKSNLPPYTVYYSFGASQSDSVYWLDKRETKDQYQIFLGGNYPELTIKTEIQNGEHLLVIKDSYANSFLPFLLADYETIHVVDLRYFHQNLDAYLNENPCSEILILYNIMNFASEKSIAELEL